MMNDSRNLGHVLDSGRPNETPVNLMLAAQIHSTEEFTVHSCNSRYLLCSQRNSQRWCLREGKIRTKSQISYRKKETKRLEKRDGDVTVPDRKKAFGVRRGCCKGSRRGGSSSAEGNRKSSGDSTSRGFPISSASLNNMERG